MPLALVRVLGEAMLSDLSPAPASRRTFEGALEEVASRESGARRRG